MALGELSCTDPAALSLADHAELAASLRYAPQAGRFTCIYQAASASLGRPVRVRVNRKAGAVPWSAQTLATLFPGMLTESPTSHNRVFVWNNVLVNPSGVAFTIWVWSMHPSKSR